MIISPTVLVLGAGASQPYGLPLGWELRRDILAMGEESVYRLPFARGANRSNEDAGEFLAAFRLSHDRSIDAFLARNERYLDIGVHAIAATLLPCESDKTLLQQEPADHWYQHLLDAMEAPWKRLHENRISFVTFNYDRSLERFMTTTLAYRHGRSLDEAAALVAQFSIVHVYGSLGSLDRRSSEYVPFGIRDDRGYLAKAASGIKIVAQGRDDSPEFAQARTLFKSAEVLCFLGFSFDDTNIARLGGPLVYAGGIEPAGNRVTTRFAASGYGLTPAERQRAAGRIGQQWARPTVLDGFQDAKCLDTLRRSLILYG